MSEGKSQLLMGAGIAAFLAAIMFAPRDWMDTPAFFGMNIDDTLRVLCLCVFLAGAVKDALSLKEQAGSKSFRWDVLVRLLLLVPLVGMTHSPIVLGLGAVVAVCMIVVTILAFARTGRIGVAR
ncbi:MAG TPA: hypothetical protein VGG48_17205 [Rhizomicrobium sp.]|jgi:hypothetical protein